uniref:PKD domain-containing protein n=1 Tax=Methanosarcina barkeri TaxID=2208 RepID=UPI00311EFE21
MVTKAGYIIVKGSTTNTESAKNTESVKDTETTENIESTENTVQEPVADFFAFSTSGNAPHTTEFMDKSTGNPTDWYWEFGDGATSTKRDPVHTYQDPGSYTVILTATNDAGSDVVTKAGYIIVKGSTTNTESTTTTESVKDTETTENIESTENTVQEPVADFFAFFSLLVMHHILQNSWIKVQEILLIGTGNLEMELLRPSEIQYIRTKIQEAIQ